MNTFDDINTLDFCILDTINKVKRQAGDKENSYETFEK